MNKEWKCPRCGRVTTDYPALSRRDNKTKICSQCGTDEAFADFFGIEQFYGKGDAEYYSTETLPVDDERNDNMWEVESDDC